MSKSAAFPAPSLRALPARLPPRRSRRRSCQRTNRRRAPASSPSQTTGSIRARSQWLQARPCAPACATPPRLRRYRPLSLILLLLDYTRAQHHAGAVVVQLEREDQHVPHPAGVLLRQMRQPSEFAVDISLARLRHGADDLSPLAIHLGELFEQVAAGKPHALLLVQLRE